MVKKSLFTLSLILYSCLLFSQNADSVTLVKAKWKKQRIAPKTKLYTHHFNQKNLFSANEYISYIEINRKGKAPVFAIGAEKTVLRKTSDFGKSAGAIAAVNGTFFDVKNGRSVDYIRIDGSTFTENTLGKSGERAVHQKSAVVIEDGRLSIKKWDETADWESKIAEKNVMNSGPLLTYGLSDQALLENSFNKTRHPRTCIGIKANGKVILVTVDGRNENSAGMSLFELTKIMRWLGCVSSINLDGGGSTAMWIDGFPDNGIVNFPTDNKKWDHAGERKVANVILLMKKP